MRPGSIPRFALIVALAVVLAPGCALIDALGGGGKGNGPPDGGGPPGPVPSYDMAGQIGVDCVEAVAPVDVPGQPFPGVVVNGPCMGGLQILGYDPGMQMFSTLEVLDPTVDGGPDVIVADIDNDGDGDIIAIQNGEVRIYLQDQGGFNSDANQYPGGFNPVDLAVGDIDLDARPDVIVAHLDESGSNSSISGLIQDIGQVTFTSMDLGFGSTLRPAGVTAGDWDGDNDVDLAISEPGGAVFVAYNHLTASNPDFSGSVVTGTGCSGPDIANEMLDSDNLPDLAVATGCDKGTMLLFSNADVMPPKFQAPLFAPGTAPTSVVAVEGNRDGLTDLAVAGLTGARILINDPKQPGNFLGGPFLGQSPAVGIAVADFDGDGLPDAAVARSDPAGIEMYLARP